MPHFSFTLPFLLLLVISISQPIFQFGPPPPHSSSTPFLALKVHFDGTFSSHPFASFLLPTPPQSYVPFSGCSPAALGRWLCKQGKSTKVPLWYTFASFPSVRRPPPVVHKLSAL